MPAHRQDAKAAAMYRAYLGESSLEAVAKAFGVSRQSVYKMFKQRGLSLRPRPKPLPAVVFAGRTYSLRKVGYYGCTNGKRGYLHRHVWEAAHGPIQVGYDVHHIDGDRWNNRVANLALLSKPDHARLHARRKR